MGATNLEHYSNNQILLSAMCKALGHPARLAIMEYLLSVDNCICGDIVNELPLSQPTVSQHLKELKNAGLIKGNIEGNAICYCIHEDAAIQLQNYFTNITRQLQLKKMKCC